MVKDKYLSEGWPGRIDEFEFDWIRKRETMCRTHYMDIMKELAAQRENGFLQSKGTRPIFIDGLNGTGKSIALAHSVLFARATGWLTLYVPDGQYL